MKCKKIAALVMAVVMMAAPCSVNATQIEQEVMESKLSDNNKDNVIVPSGYFDYSQQDKVKYYLYRIGYEKYAAAIDLTENSTQTFDNMFKSGSFLNKYKDKLVELRIYGWSGDQDLEIFNSQFPLLRLLRISAEDNNNVHVKSYNLHNIIKADLTGVSAFDDVAAKEMVYGTQSNKFAYNKLQEVRLTAPKFLFPISNSYTRWEGVKLHDDGSLYSFGEDGVKPEYVEYKRGNNTYINGTNELLEEDTPLGYYTTTLGECSRVYYNENKNGTCTKSIYLNGVQIENSNGEAKLGMMNFLIQGSSSGNFVAPDESEMRGIATDFSFGGYTKWYITDNFNEKASWTTIPQDGKYKNETMFIKLIPKQFIITYAGLRFDDDVAITDNPTIKSIDQDVVLKDVSYEGYTFLGWYDESGNKVSVLNQDYNMDLVLFARWEEIPKATEATTSVIEESTEKVTESILDELTEELTDEIKEESNTESVEKITEDTATVTDSTESSVESDTEDSTEFTKSTENIVDSTEKTTESTTSDWFDDTEQPATGSPKIHDTTTEERTESMTTEEKEIDVAPTTKEKVVEDETEEPAEWVELPTGSTETETEEKVTQAPATQAPVTEAAKSTESSTQAPATQAQVQQSTQAIARTEQVTEAPTTEVKKEVVEVALKKPTIKSVKNSKKGKIVITFKSKAQSKYEIEVSTSKNFKNGVKTYSTSKKSYTVKKMVKGKTYWVRARGYKTENGNTILGKWSKVKKVQIKK